MAQIRGRSNLRSLVLLLAKCDTLFNISQGTQSMATQYDDRDPYEGTETMQGYVDLTNASAIAGLRGQIIGE